MLPYFRVGAPENLRSISAPALEHADKDLEILGSKDLMQINLTSLSGISG